MASHFLSASRLARFPKLVAAVRFGVPTAVVLALSLACGASEGDRLATGMCPPGEVCSATVTGLWFEGIAPARHSIFGIARGGMQRLEIWPPSMVDGGRGALPDFLASTASPEVQIANFGRTTPSSGEVTLHGFRAGETLLRITAARDGSLLDRLTVRVAEVAAAGLHTPECMAFGLERLGHLDPRDEQCHAVWSGSRTRAAFVLVDAAGDLLWDDTLSHERVAPTEASEAPWGVVVDVEAPASGTLRFEMVGHSGLHVVELPVVSDVVEVWLDGLDGAEETVPVGTPMTLCAVGAIDDADSIRRPVLGAPATFVGDGLGLTIEPAPESDAALDPSAANCRSLTLANNVRHRFTVTIGTVSNVYTLTPALVGTTALAGARVPPLSRIGVRPHAVRKPLAGERLRR